MHRRLLLGLLSAVVLPQVARSQQANRTAKVAVLMDLAKDEPLFQARTSALVNGLRERGWIEGRNLSFEWRAAGGDPELTRRFAAELVAASPDVIVASSSFVTDALQRQTQTIPIVFTMVLDSIVGRFVQSFSRPGGNITGFTNFDPAMTAKWIELLIEVRPGLRKVDVLLETGSASAGEQLAGIGRVAAPRGIHLFPTDVRDSVALERVFAAAKGDAGTGVIVTSGGSSTAQKDTIIRLAASNGVPTVYSGRHHAVSGGLISYGPDTVDPFRRACAYVDRILRGESPANLPVQIPVRFELIVNLKTARAMGMEMPDLLLARADELIE